MEISLHCKYSVAFKNSGLLSGSSLQYGGDVLERSKELAVDGAQHSALTDLTANIETETWKKRFSTLKVKRKKNDRAEDDFDITHPQLCKGAQN